MAREIGKAGKTLYKRLLRIAALLGGLGLAFWLLVKLTVPWMGALALPQRLAFGAAEVLERRGR